MDRSVGKTHAKMWKFRELPPRGIVNAKTVDPALQAFTTNLKTVKMPLYQPYGVDLSNEAYGTYVLRDPNELRIKLLPFEGHGFTLVFLYTYKSPRSTIKCVQRFKRNVRKALGHKRSRGLLNRLALYYVPIENSPECLESLKGIVYKALSADLEMPCWGFANPAGLTKGISYERV